MLGRIQPAHFPTVFGPRGRRSRSIATWSRRSFEQLAARDARATGRDATAEALAEGFLQIAVQNMANAIKKISVARGYDVTAVHAAMLRRRRRPARLRAWPTRSA